MVRSKLLAVFVALWWIQVVPVEAQVCASQLKSSMACVVPQVYGPDGLTFPTQPTPFLGGQLINAGAGFSNFVLPLQSVGTELALRSITSPASGVLFTFDKTLGTITQSTESYGPILAERAETVGRHRVFLAATYDFRDFSSLDGVSLKHLPVALPHVANEFNGTFPAGGFPCPQFPSDPFVFDGCAAFDADFVTTQDRIDLKVHEVTLYATYGLTSRVDLSVAVPILDVRLGITSSAHIVRAAVPQPVPTSDLNYAFTSGTGYYLFFDATNPASSVNKTFSPTTPPTGSPDFKSVTGVGDLVLRAKGTAWNGERIRMALGLEVRTPTGDAANFLGSGAIGVKPFLAASYAARVSPHVNLGFEYNGQSILAGNVQTDKVGKLPNEFFYAAGADARVSKRVTLSADMLGTRLSSTDRIRVVPFVNSTIDGIAYPGVFTIVSYKAPVNMIDIAAGAKYSPFAKLIVTGNVVFKANNAGLRANVVPLAGVSYTF
jgi:hypothetical protein